MNCVRCGGLRRVIVLREESSGECVPGWQCLLCGDVGDPLIEANRNGSAEPPTSRARPPGTPTVRVGRCSLKRWHRQ